MICLYKFENNIPIYIQISDCIAKDIISGKYPIGSKIPTVRELATIFSANPNTCQKAVTELTNQGLLVTVSTNGRFVTKDEQLITDYRNKILMEIVADFVHQIKEFGFKKEEVLEKMEKENQNGMH